MDAETRKKVKALEAKLEEQGRARAKVIEENDRLEKKVYELQAIITRQADELAGRSDSALQRENEKYEEALQKIADGRGKYANVAKRALNGKG